MKCRICRSGVTYKIFSISRGQVFKCKSCTGYSVSEHTKTESNNLFYETINQESYHGYLKDFRQKQYHDEISNLQIKLPAKLLDVGASYGWLLEVADKLGYDAYGLEPGMLASNHKIIRMTIEDYSKGNLSLYDVITSWHSLEHTYSCDDAIKAIKSILIEGGNLLIAVPTSDGFIFKIAYILKKYFKSDFLMEEIFYTHNVNMHFMYMNKEALSYILEKNGFKIYSCKTIECFDWKNFHKRFASPFMKYLLRIIWMIPVVIKISKYYNLIIAAYKKQ